ncbi:MAG TPA: substrate-binding domain-containing protein [Dictyobacter sp.]|nr:substrate-binding domain-containing protein [Dictyobacter sp.]
MKIRGCTNQALYASLITFLLSTVLLSACSSTTANNNGANKTNSNGKGCTKVGILLPETISSTRWETKDRPLLIQAVQNAIPNVHIDYSNAQGNSDTQFNQATTDLNNGDCILIVAPHDSVAAASIVEEARNRNVPVIAYDRLIQSKYTNYYVSFDASDVGRLQGQYIMDHYSQYTATGTEANVVMISGSQTDANALQFSQGMHEALDPFFADNNLNEISETFTPNYNPVSAETEMQVALSDTQNNIQIAYVANDEMADGVISVLKAAHLNGKVLVTGQDATTTGIHNILTGDQMMTIYKPIGQEAESVGTLIQSMYLGLNTNNLTQGNTIPTADGGSIPALFDLPIVVDKTNIATTVLADKYVTKSEICAGLPAGTDNIC